MLRKGESVCENCITGMADDWEVGVTFSLGSRDGGKRRHVYSLINILIQQLIDLYIYIEISEKISDEISFINLTSLFVSRIQ